MYNNYLLFFYYVFVDEGVDKGAESMNLPHRVYT